MVGDMSYINFKGEEDVGYVVEAEKEVELPLLS